MRANRFIGITGGIGSGKSTVSLFWSAYARLPLINVDHLCRELLDIEMPGWVALKTNLDTSFFEPDGQLNRQGLRSAIFDDDTLRQRVDQLIHPLALSSLNRKAADLKGPVLVDVPLLFEAKWEEQFRRTVVVYADQKTCCKRVSNRDAIPREEAAKAIVSQMGIGEKAMLADHVVDNSYCWIIARMQVAHLAKLITGIF